MALVLRSDAGPGKGRQILKEAVDTFRAKLTDDERKAFDDRRAADPLKPEEDSIMALIVEIDSKNSQKLSRYVAPKLRAFLEAVQQFTGIVDAFITFAPEPIAQLVWASVKVTFSLLSSFGEYFDELCALFYQIGENCPRLREFGSLYESSTSLQNVLCLYFAEVVIICGKALKVSRQPGIKLLFKATFKPFKKEFGDSQDNLNKYSAQIKEEISLAFSKVQVQEEKLDKIERNKNEGFRNQVALFSSTARKELADIRQWQIQAEKRRVEAMRRQIKDNLCSLDPGIAWKQARRQCLAQTGEWFRQNTNFTTWIGQNSSIAMAYLANLGSGKTIVTSNVIAHLSLLDPSSANVAYFFCQSETVGSLQSRNVLGGIARQLLEVAINGMDGPDLEDLLQKSASPNDEDVLALILAHQTPNGSSYIVIDGVDECEVAAMEVVLHSLRTLIDSTTNKHILKIFLSSRPDYAHRIEAHLNPLLRLAPTTAELEHDLDAYIGVTLKTKLEQGQLNLNQPELIVIIQNALLSGAQGMFLWAYLLIEDLCLRNNDNDILTALKNIPSKLSELFDRLLTKAVDDEINGHVSKKLLKWTVGARRALSLDEIREAATIEVGQKMLDTAALPNDVYRSINCCYGLLCIDEDDLKVRLVHPSLKQHTFSQEAEYGPKRWRLHSNLLQTELASLCMTYLEFSEFTQTLVKVKTPPPVAKPSDLALEVAGIGKHRFSTADKAIALLRGPHGKSSPADTTKILLDVRKNLDDIAQRNKKSKPMYGRSKFIDYARSNWIHHCAFLEKDIDEATWKTFCRFVKSSDTHFEKAWIDTDTARKLTEPLKFFKPPEYPAHVVSTLIWAAENNHLTLLDYEFSESVFTRGSLDLRKSKPPPIQKLVDWESVLKDLHRALPTKKAEFAGLVCNRLNSLADKVAYGSDLAFLHDFLAVFYDPIPRKIKMDDYHAGRQPLGELWSFQRLEDCGYAVTSPPEPPPISEIAAAHKMGKIWFNSEYPYRGSLLLAMAAAMDRADHLKLLVDVLSSSAPWSIFPVIETAIVYHRAALADLMFRKSRLSSRAKPGDDAGKYEQAIGRAYQYYLPGLLSLALEHKMNSLAELIAIEVKEPGVKADQFGNLALMYACEHRNVDIYARLLMADADVEKANDYGVSVRDFVQQSYDYLNTAIANGTAPPESAEKVAQMLAMTKLKAAQYLQNRIDERLAEQKRKERTSSNVSTAICCFLALLVMLIILGGLVILLAELWYMIFVVIVGFVCYRLTAAKGS